MKNNHAYNEAEKQAKAFLGNWKNMYGPGLEQLTPPAVERLVDAGFRHRQGSRPVDYLRHWLGVARAFAKATPDDSWGELEKLLAIVFRRLVVAERRVEVLEGENNELRRQNACR